MLEVVGRGAGARSTMSCVEGKRRSRSEARRFPLDGSQAPSGRSRRREPAARRSPHPRPRNGRPGRRGWASGVGHGLPPRGARRPTLGPRGKSRGWSRLAVALDLAEAVHGRPIQPPSGQAVPRAQTATRARTTSPTSCAIRGRVRAAGSTEHQGHRSDARPHEAATQPRPLAGRSRRSRWSWRPAPSRNPSPRDRLRARPARRPAPQRRVPRPGDPCRRVASSSLAGPTPAARSHLSSRQRRDVDIAVGERLPTLPQRPLGRDIWWWLTKLGGRPESRSTQSSASGCPARRRDRRRPQGAEACGVTVRPRASRASERRFASSDGETGEYDVVIWATGFRVDHSWIDIPELKDENGSVRHARGVTSSPGLYLLGMTWQHKRTSALLGWVAEDAALPGRPDRIDQRISRSRRGCGRAGLTNPGG